MNWKNTIRGLIGGAKKAGKERGVLLKGGGITKFHGDPSSIPVTPEPNYICKNCGMLIESTHGHTREECHDYRSDPTTPDLSLRKVMMGKPPMFGFIGRNDPPIRLPHYHSLSGKAKDNE